MQAVAAGVCRLMHHHFLLHFFLRGVVDGISSAARFNKSLEEVYYCQIVYRIFKNKGKSYIVVSLYNTKHILSYNVVCLRRPTMLSEKRKNLTINCTFTKVVVHLTLM